MEEDPARARLSPKQDGICLEGARRGKIWFAFWKIILVDIGEWITGGKGGAERSPPGS